MKLSRFHLLWIFGMAGLVALFAYRLIGSGIVSFSSGDRTTAVGLRGNSPVSKELSPIQSQRLKKHFLEEPPVAHTSGQGDVRSQVNAINEFNRKQRP